MEVIKQYIPYLIPIILIELALLIAALVDLVRRAHTRWLPKWGWALVILFVNFIGPIIYFVAGRSEE
ncbi:MAG TPA: PLD nuclease N-terminal domain-containing protein [Anaerolineales bacterium]